MKLIHVTCKGLSALLMDRMTDEVLEGLFTGTHAPKSKDRKMEDDARKKIYEEDGQPVITAECLFATLVNAGKGLKFDGKRNISTGDSTLLPSFMSIRETAMPLYRSNGEPHIIGGPKGGPEKTWRVDKRRGRLDSGTAVCVVRARFDEWSFGFTLEVNEKLIDLGRVRQLVANAGNAVGLLSYRPACKGPFGRFGIAKWEVEDLPDEEGMLDDEPAEDKELAEV